MPVRHLIVLDIVGLSTRYLRYEDQIPNITNLAKTGISAKLIPDFPCVTSTVQASILSGMHPNRHGVICNGYYDRESHKTTFWGRPSNLVQARRIWDIIKAENEDYTTAVLFWQQIMDANADIVITPKPKHLDTGETISWCHTEPAGYYEELVKAYGDFPLMNYWGPMASIKSSQWIVKAAIHTLKRFTPNLMLVYIPHLDYSAQRYGPEDPRTLSELTRVDDLVGEIIHALQDLQLSEEAAIMLVSEYGFTDVSGAVLPNVILRDNGLLDVKVVDGKEYIDFSSSKAFAMVDHQIAHIFVSKPCYIKQVRSLLESVEGIKEALDEDGKRQFHLDHPLSGELVAISETDRWFAYYWWNDPSKAPDFARTVDIHRKPGFDPVELFLEENTRSIPLEPGLVKGSHGCPPYSDDQKAAFILSCDDLSFSLEEEIHCTHVAPIMARLLGVEHR